MALWCFLEKPYQLSEICLPGSPVKSSHHVRSYTSGPQTGGQGVIKNLVTGFITQSTQPPIRLIKTSWQAQLCCIFPRSMHGKMTSLYFSFASGLVCLWYMLCCSCCLSCKTSAVLLQLRYFSCSELHWYFDAVFQHAALCQLLPSC